MATAPAHFLKSKPKELRRYEGHSYKGRSCPKHKGTKLVKDDHECCGCCCSGCEPKYTCPKCEKAYNSAYQKWFNKWGHTVAVGENLHVENGRLLVMSPIRYMQFLHGGKPIKIGSWCKMGEDGFVKRTTKRWTPNMLVIG